MANSNKKTSLCRPSLPISNKESFDPIVEDTVFAWLDNVRSDFEKFRRQFCAETSAHREQWIFFDKDTECYEFIEKKVSHPKKIVLITSGQLGASLIKNLHDCNQLDSIYIYCQNVDKYKAMYQSVTKVLGICSNPVELYSRLIDNCRNVLKENAPLTNDRCNFTDGDHIEPFSQVNLSWHRNIGTIILPGFNQITTVIQQNISTSFEIILSSSSHLAEITNTKNFSITLAVNNQEVILKTHFHGQEHLLDIKNESYCILQSNNNGNQEYVYWIHFSRETLTVMYGIGEIRPKFKVLEAVLDEKHIEIISKISYLHVKLDNTYESIETIDYLAGNIRFLIGNLPLSEPVLCQSYNSSLNEIATYVPPSPLDLNKSCRLLSQRLNHFQFHDNKFPDLIQAIEYSLKHHGWCYQKLFEKANQFGRVELETTYLRLNFDSIIIEIWPPGHCSPIHNHNKAYGAFRVLYGSILIRLFPTLMLNPRYDTAIEYLLRQDQTTWMLPTLNQTHQMKNIEMNSCCIIAQCYNNDNQKKATDEIVDYINPSNGNIQKIKLESDMDFIEFKEKIKDEWNTR